MSKKGEKWAKGVFFFQLRLQTNWVAKKWMLLARVVAIWGFRDTLQVPKPFRRAIQTYHRNKVCGKRSEKLLGMCYKWHTT